ncbi:pyridoxamine 5'-phosphate oxidase family protein [Kineosporia succinea]|uniref:Nitroimidazol reductase NimA-like FMN-containing flavoprotein (Pyridoxamine 5'-phosphate oxidase superfamily) n=1 Tax=Kineosporia succinea TaxID=84632 RepID=A0ABT9P165_9ACTN|nr:pyridoxamine 5'-phosphate oxidase family protein [Kineosporia succinea]MDP9826419.1 nitroimidazol reductase NimA-like FMN-containing flavoprotein (pyridoxamine 5'-phosphate oxidase superfamily) [Kineosporia succinea]
MTTEPNAVGSVNSVAAEHQLPTYTRRSDQTRYDAQAINAALDEAFLCHVAYIDSGDPIVVPVTHSRVGEELLLRVGHESRLAELATDGDIALCVTVTLLDGLVLARAEVDNAINYRSIVIRGTGSLVKDPAAKLAGLDAIVEHLVAGRSKHTRPPNEEEAAEVVLLSLPLEDVALKTRTGPPQDAEEDLSLHHWAGVISVRNAYGPPFPSPDLPYDRQVPAQLANYNRSAKPQGYR